MVRRLRRRVDDLPGVFPGRPAARVSVRAWPDDQLRPRVRRLCISLMLLASVALLPVVPGNGWKPHGGEDPAARILGLLIGVVGLPYFLLSSTGPLLQSWYARRETGTFPTGFSPSRTWRRCWR